MSGNNGIAEVPVEPKTMDAKSASVVFFVW
jgi:hypothetical protein